MYFLRVPRYLEYRIRILRPYPQVLIEVLRSESRIGRTFFRQIPARTPVLPPCHCRCPSAVCGTEFPEMAVDGASLKHWIVGTPSLRAFDGDPHQLADYIVALVDTQEVTPPPRPSHEDNCFVIAVGFFACCTPRHTTRSPMCGS